MNPAQAQKAEAKRRLEKTIRILSTGAKGGPGKSFLVKNLAGAAARDGYNVGLVDFDTQRTVTKWLQRRLQYCPDSPEIVGYEADPHDSHDASEVLAIEDHDIILFDTPPAIDQSSEVLKTLSFGVDLGTGANEGGYKRYRICRNAAARAGSVETSDAGHPQPREAQSEPGYRAGEKALGSARGTLRGRDRGVR